MAKGAIRVDWYPKNALDGMKFLTVMEELAYRRIIDLIYTEGGELPDDDDLMAEQTRTFKEWPKVKAGLIRKEKIVIRNAQITNDKCLEILTDIQRKSDAARASGQASGRSRRKLLPTEIERPLNDRSKSVAENDDKSPTENELSQVVIESVNDTDVSFTPRVCEREVSFDDFAKAYPRPDGVNGGAKKWRELIADGVNPQDILDGLKRWVPVWEARIRDPEDSFRRQLIRSAARWLDESGWLDPTPPDGGTHTALAGRSWPGPEAIREAILIELGSEAGETFAKSFLDQGDWQEPSTILTATQYAADKLRTIGRLKTYTIRKRQENAA